MAPPTINKEEPRQRISLPVKKPVQLTSSFILIAFLLFLFLDITARLTFRQWTINGFNSPNRSWIWWAVKDFKSQKENPQILLMGSSLMVMALHGGDATWLNQPQNNVLHHRSLLFESLLNNTLKKNYLSFSFAIPGQMASDAYCICSSLLKDPQKPDFLIYGIAPRDLMDNTLSNPASTETFKYLSRVGNLSQIAIRARPSLWDRLDYWLSKVSFIYAHKADLVYLQHHYIGALFAHLHWLDDQNLVKTPFELRKIAMLELPEDNAVNEIFTPPYNPATKPLDNSSEYRARYSRFNTKLFNEQKSYLTDLMRTCYQRRIKLITVNMPLTLGNLKLMPPGFYQHYLETVKSLATSQGSLFIDLNDARVFPDDCFLDSAHLNGKGSIKFFERLTLELAKSKALNN
jgi:hypothetical protein